MAYTGVNGSKGYAKVKARIRRERIERAKLAGIDINNRQDMKVFADREFDEMIEEIRQTANKPKV